MVLPTSVSAQFRRLDKDLVDLSRMKGDAIDEEECIVVARICNDCLLTLDKAINAIWEKKGSQKEGKGKPKIYFPIGAQSRENLIQKLQQYQMPYLQRDDPRIFDIIESVQTYNGSRWLQAIHKLASIRHEDFPKINRINEIGFGIGKGQNIYIREMKFDSAGNLILNGHGINRESGMIEPVRVNTTKEVRAVLEHINEDPYHFCSSSVARVKKVVSDLYKYIS